MPALRLVAVCLAVVASACHNSAATTPPQPADAIVWADGDVLQVTPQPATSLATRVARLDVLLDLLDAARFAEDDQAREQLWRNLGDVAQRRGLVATRTASARLLGEALQLDADPSLPDDLRSFVAGAIAVLSADLGLARTGEDLAIRLAAYREVAERGHPRAVDNARWRLYDHVRGCLAGAVIAADEDRQDIAVHSFYLREDEVSAWLADTSLHSKPAWPGPSPLLTLLRETRQDVAADPRWRTVVDRRTQLDQPLEQTIAKALPSARDPAWPLATMPTGTGHRDSFLPVLWADEAAVTLAAGQPAAQTLAYAAAELGPALTDLVASDGRDAVLLAAPALLPSPAVHAILGAIQVTPVTRIELAIHEPRVPASAGVVVTQLPLTILRASDRSPTAVALRQSKLHLHLSGYGLRIAIAGRWHDLARDPATVATTLDRVRQAYPREQVVTVSIADDVLYQQLLDLVQAVVGGPARRFAAIAWNAAAAPPPSSIPARDIAAQQQRLERRAALAAESARVALDQPFPLAADDQPRLEQLAQRLRRCLPETETPFAPGETLRLDLQFDLGLLVDVTVANVGRRKLASDRRAAVVACVRDETRGFRLRQHRDLVRATVVVTPSQP